VVGGQCSVNLYVALYVSRTTFCLIHAHLYIICCKDVDYCCTVLVAVLVMSDYYMEILLMEFLVLWNAGFVWLCTEYFYVLICFILMD